MLSGIGVSMSRLAGSRISDAPIADIAERLDYNSEAAFGRAFKKFTGKTPGAVRRGDDSAIASVV
jgi:AraC-like DNA-binding protein